MPTTNVSSILPQLITFFAIPVASYSYNSTFEFWLNAFKFLTCILNCSTPPNLIRTFNSFCINQISLGKFVD